MSSNTPCAACKLQRRKCTPGCVFAPYFPPEQPGKFVCVHRVFGASNVAKLLSELSPAQREDAANSLAYEAEMRLRDPVYGCVGYISILQHRLRQVHHDLQLARKELSTYVTPPAASASAAAAPIPPFLHQLNPSAAGAGPFCGVSPAGMEFSPSASSQISMREQPQRQMAAMATAAAREQGMMMRGYEQHHQYHHHEPERLNACFSDGCGGRTQSSHHQLSPLEYFEAPLQSVQPPQHSSGGGRPQHHRYRTRSDDEGRSGIS